MLQHQPASFDEQRQERERRGGERIERRGHPRRIDLLLGEQRAPRGSLLARQLEELCQLVIRDVLEPPAVRYGPNAS